MRFEEIQKKAGVSLVTVLLFMLVATIAATATYKWLTSEGRSSASRMQQNEAYQSAVAGIESARSWMTYNANETGAIIKQYKDGKNAPVKLTDRLAVFMRAGQHYDVYLVGVNTENSTYKLKLLSEGTARNGGAKHSEVAILNVNGLYQVINPKKKVKKSPVDFDTPYFGGTSTGTQSEFSSIMINGDWQGNQGDYPEKFIVTGNANLTGNHNNIGKKYSCIGGDLSLDMQGITSGGNLFVGGNVSKAKIKIDSSAWFEGNVDQTDGQTSNYLIIGKSVTLNGTFKTNQVTTDRYVSIGEDFCATESGRVISKGALASFVVQGNVWLPGSYNISTDPSNPGIDNYASYDKIVLGNTAESKVYIKAGHHSSDYVTLRSNRTFPESANHPQKCNTGLGDVNNIYPPWTKVGEKCNSDYAVFWDGDSYPVYQTAHDSKSDLYYMYYLEDGYTDVDFGQYSDTYWRWEHDCSYWGCQYNPDTKMNGYFVYFKPNQKNYNYVYTNSRHVQSNDNGYNHQKNYKADYGWYRFLNYSDEGQITGSPYCGFGDEYRPSCGVTPWFKSNGTLSNDMSLANKPDCAQAVYDSCDMLWDKTPGCPGSNYFIDDPIEIPLTELEAYANKGCDKPGAKSWGPKLVEDLNKCWAENYNDPIKKSTNLYNGEYQVVKLTEGDGKNDISGTLVGKFVIIAEMKITGRNEFITAADDGKSFALLYLKEGAHILPTTDKRFKHLFIYMNEANDGAEAFPSHLHLTGTLYFPAAKCIGNRFQDADFESDTDLISDLSSNGVICKKGVPCAASTPGGGGDPALGVEYEEGKPDEYFISVAPQLSVTLESQYKNNESIGELDNAPNVDPSFIVLPRIIYVTKDAKGELSDYYNIVPLNAVTAVGSTSPISGTNVVCEGGIPPSGKLAAAGNLTEGPFACAVTATVNGKAKSAQKTVPFWVVVAGEGGSNPSVSFVNASEELAIGNTAAVELTWDKTTGAGRSCTAVITATDFGTEWKVLDPAVTPDGNKFTVTFNTSEEPPKKLLDIRNESSNDGSVMFMITNTEGCSPGNKRVEVVYNTNSIVVERKGLAEYCSGEAGAGVDACNGPDGEYYKMIQSSWPDCNVDETWVSAEGNNCTPLPGNNNNKWTCGITGAVSLTSPGNPVGCRVVIPSTNNSKSGPFETNEVVTLYAALKAIPQTFHVKFDVTGDLPDDQPIYISVNGTSRAICTYGDYKDATRRAEKCDVSVYRGALVKLSFNSDPSEESDPPKSFNYWMCNEGADCKSDEPIITSSYVMSVTGSNTVVAHFGEKDKHCFFDEFKDENHYDRTSVTCDESNPLYCIETCDGTCGTVATGETKWRLLEGSMDIIEYADGRISLKSKATRGKKESEKANIRAVVMSTAQAGKDGELKAQFQVPFEGVSAGDNAKATVKNSGFILRSDASKLNFLMLNVFATSNGTLKARLCVNGAEDRCKTLTFSNLRTISATDIIMMSAKLSTNAGVDQLKVKVWPGSWATDLQADEVTFNLVESEISGITATAKNEYVGYSLADQNFKLYGIGWKSDTYNAQCWDTPPTISCSFKAAYTGGIVPLEEPVNPWVGFSAWYSDAKASGCAPIYYYNGDDVASCVTSIDGTDYKTCGTSYQFRDHGAHGYSNYSNNERKEIKTAKAGVEGCYVTGPAAAWANQGVAAHCGAFWVGRVSECSSHTMFEYTTGGPEGDYYGVTDVANVRDASLNVVLNNPAGDEVEIYLYSINSDGLYPYGASKPIYSLPYKTVGTGTISIPVKDLSNVDGFDPERVGGVYVKTNGSASVTSVTSACPNVVEIRGCSANYVKSANKWNITTELSSEKTYTHVKKIEVRETSDFITEGSDESEDPWTSSTKTLSIADANPYGDVVRIYTFSVTLTTDENDILTCNTEPDTISAYGRECLALSGGTSFKQGTGLPVFSYKVVCPNGPCDYKIVLSDGTVIEDASTDTDIEWNTDQNAANKTTALEVGEYYFTLQSKDGKFSSCNSATFNVTSSAVTGTCDITGNPYQGQQLTLNVSNISGDVSNSGSDMTWTLTDGGSNTVTKPIKCSPSTCWENQLTAPAAGDYTYSLTFGGKNVCPDGNITINPKLTCSATKKSLTLGEKFDFIANYGGDCWNATFSGNGASFSDCNMNYSSIQPTVVGEQIYTFSVTNGSIGTASCSDTVEVGEATPTATCPTGTINAEPGTTIEFTPTVTGCGSGCNYTVEWVGHSGDPKKSVTDYSYKSGDKVSFVGDATDGTNYYRFTVVNKKTSDNTATCAQDITVSYQKPTYDCPTDKEEAVGATVAVTPTSVTNCTQGCGYKVTKGSSTGTEVIGPGTGYTSGALGSGFTGESTARTVTYYVTLSNPAGDGTPCDFDVTYTEQTCTEYMTQYVIGQNDGNKDNIGPFSTGCYKINTGKACSSTQIYTSGSGTVTVNGSQFDCSKNYQVVSITPQAIMDVSIENCTVTKFYVYDCNAVASSSSVTPASSGSGGGEATSISVGYGTDNFKSFTPGTTYNVTITAGGSVFRCISSTAPAYVRPVGTFNNVTFDIDAYNTGSRNNPANPGAGSTVTFVVDPGAPSDLKCGTDW